jgi:hypothetical protein
MASEFPTGFLTLRAGTFQRVSRATREGDVRAINISNCAVDGWSVHSIEMGDNKLNGRSFAADEQLLVCIMEAKPGGLLWEEDPEKIGALSADSMHANLFCRPTHSLTFGRRPEPRMGPCAISKSY